jgi:putative Holliday junction resolvase
MITELLQEFYILSKSGPILCLDYGAKRTGVAISDTRRIMSFPIFTIKANNQQDRLKQIKDIIKKKNVGSIVIGLPLYLNGTESDQTKITRQFANSVHEETKLPIFLQDERLSSKGADSYLKRMEFNRKERDRMSDMTSASLILDIVLERMKNLEQ